MLTDLTLDTLAQGPAGQAFAGAIRRIEENLGDATADPAARREVSLRVLMTPDEESGALEVRILVSAKLAPSAHAVVGLVETGTIQVPSTQTEMALA